MEGNNMQCPKCQFENREGVKFCEECGAEFGLECPVCKANIPLGRKFCGECGHKIDFPVETPPKDLSFDYPLTKSLPKFKNTFLKALPKRFCLNGIESKANVSRSR
jgi:predicted amidophosphoribosyltransferase